MRDGIVSELVLSRLEIGLGVVAFTRSMTFFGVLICVSNFDAHPRGRAGGGRRTDQGD